MKLDTENIRTIKVSDKKYYSITDAIGQLAPHGSAWDGKDNAIYLEADGKREPYSDKETLMNILKRLEQPPESLFDKMLKGILNVPKDQNIQ